MNASDLYERTLQPRYAVELGRQWLLDLDWDDEDVWERIKLSNAVGVIDAVNRHYYGGWVAFAKTEGLWNGFTPREREGLPRDGECPTQCPLCGEISRLCACE